MPPFELAARTVYWFFVYGLLGWCAEVIFAAVKEHRLVNRGFLCGPICPIYGFGMVALLYAARALGAPGLPLSVPVVFVVGGVLTTLLELVAGWGLYRLFRIRWWDYTGIPFNLGGYICPQFSLLWGLGSVVMVKGLHPLLARLGDRIPLQALLPLDLILLLVFAVDTAASAAAAAGLDRKLKEIDELRARLRRTSDRLTELLGTGAMTADTLLDEQKLQLALARMERRDDAEALREELTTHAAALRARLREMDLDRFGARRLLRAFPRMRSLRYGETLAATREALRTLARRAREARQAARDAAKRRGRS
ncbi:MAG TPA: putative ABC transporter permease [Candidatus Gemmiger avistercoris]|uniref:ABC transporter permease n=1 Tax=Candidatus Gemmiger avistercoris TaxID=2838606 RepID=A0A9D2FM30_9FIRM|nr:putative ABC transporter permease [uncultured Subdoligranulum sp.]HIZ62905.1 putative ABC transporter permease [Candidatus Gemmiger avistercoris]